MSKKLIFIIILNLFILFIALFFDPAEKSFNFKADFIFLNMRIPRVLLAFFVGALLSLAGFLCQHLFRNALATPDILGFSAGAAAMIVVFQHFFPNLQKLLQLASGFLGAMLAMGLLLSVIVIFANYSIYVILMTGVALGLFFSAFVVLAQYLMDYSQSYLIMRWLLGGLQTAGINDVILVFVLLLIQTGFLVLLKTELLLLATPEAFAESHGVETKKLRIAALVLLAIVIGGTVSVAGPVGFVALIVPHFALILVKGNYLQRITVSFLIGGGLLTMADFLSRAIIYPAEIPVGAITSFIGAPYFVILLIKNLRIR